MRSCSQANYNCQVASTSGRSSDRTPPVQYRFRSTRVPLARRNVAVQALGVDSHRTFYPETDLDTDNTTVSIPTAAEAQQYVEQYQQLKTEMVGRTQRFGGLLAAYLFLTVSAEAAFCALLGSAASYGYLTLMQRQVDSVSPTDTVPMWDAEDNVQGLARPFAIAIAGYRAGLRPRLLVPIGLGAGIWACNHSGLHMVSHTEEGCLILGFLSFKAALLLNVWDSLKPKFDPQAFKRPKQPVQYNFDEEPNIDDIMVNIASVRKIGGKKF